MRPHRIELKAFATACLFLLFTSYSWAQAQTHQTHWVASWAAAQQLPEPQNSLAADDLRDATLRQIVHLSLGGRRLRVHLSNAFGNAPLEFTAVHIARAASPSSAKIVEGTDTALSFAGAPSVIIPAGAEYLSDPVDFPAPALSDLAITLQLAAPPAQQTGHPGSRATSYLAHGDLVSAADLAGAKTVEHWYWIAAVDVAAPPRAAAIVALGDSITDGHGATTNGNDRWPDVLARRVESQSRGVLNAGIGGNRVLLDGLGPNALARFDRDVLAPAGVRWVIVLEGVNDLGTLARLQEVPRAEHDALVAHLLAAYQQMIERAHAHGIRVIGATILPYAGSNYYHPGPEEETDRAAINKWIRASGHFDAVIDFDQLMRDPAHPDHLLPSYDSGDHLHPSAAGYRHMGEAIPLSLFGQ